MVLALPVHVDGKGQILAGLKEVQLFFQQQRVRAQIDVFLASDQPFDNLVDLRVHERLAAWNRDHRCPALVHGLEALFRRQFLFQDVRRILNFAATCASQIAAKQRLEHQHKRIALPPAQLLFQHIGCNGPSL